MALLTQLNTLETTGLIRLAAVQPELEYLFRHALVQDAAYGSLLKNDRKSLHQAVGEALELHYPQQRDELAATLALHFEKADAHEKALHYFVLAGHRASESYANTEALAFYESALAQAAQLPTTATKLASLHESIGDVYKRIAQHEAARTHYDEAHALQGTLLSPDTTMQARVHRKIGATLTIQRQFAEADNVWEKAERYLGALSDASAKEAWDEWLEIQVERTWRYYWVAATDEMETLCQRFLPLVEQRGTAEQKARALTIYCLYLFRCERLVASDVTIALQRKAIHYAQESQKPPLVFDGYFGLGFFYLLRRELPEAEEALQASFALAERMGAPVYLARSANYLMLLARMRDQLEKAQSYFAVIEQNNWAGPMADYTPQVRACEAWVAWRNGDWVTAEACTEAAMTKIKSAWAVYPMKWLVSFPALAVAVAQRQTDTAAEWAQTLLEPLQMRLPADLTTRLETGLRLAPQDAEATQIALAEAVQLARGYGYL